MIFTHTNTSNTVNGKIGIKGTTSNPYLTVKEVSGYTNIGSYPPEMKLKDYVSKENNTFLTNNNFQFIFKNSKIGHSSFKLDEGLYMNIRPDGFTRFNRLTQTLVTTNFTGANEIPTVEMNKLLAWITSQGYEPAHEDTLSQTVPVNVPSGSPLVTFNTNIITPVAPGGIDGLEESESVWNFWDKIDNDRFMKKLPTKSNLGNYIIISDFFDVATGTENPLPLIPELKVKVRSVDSNGDTFLDTFNIILDSSITNEFIMVKNSNNSIQVLFKKDANSYVVKLVWDKLLITTAIITDAVLYDNI